MVLTLLASFGSAIVGGLIGALAVALVYRGQRRARRRELFDEALAELMREMSAHAATLRGLAKDSTAHIPEQVPDNSRVVRALTIAQISATPQEYEVLQRLSSPIAFVSSGVPRFWDEAGYYEAWIAELMIWRRGIITAEKAQGDFLSAEKTFLGAMGAGSLVVEK